MKWKVWFKSTSDVMKIVRFLCFFRQPDFCQLWTLTNTLLAVLYHCMPLTCTVRMTKMGTGKMAADRLDPHQLLLQLVQTMQSTSGNTNASTASTSGAVAREHRLLFRGRSRRRERDDSRSNDDGEVVFLLGFTLFVCAACVTVASFLRTRASAY